MKPLLRMKFIFALLVSFFLLSCNLLRQVIPSPQTATLTPVNAPPTSTFTPAPTSDPRILNPDNQHWYLLINFEETWSEAVSDCVSRGAHLATIQSDAENQFVFGLTRFTWLGGTDEGREGNWVWITGEPWEYTNWVFGEPNNHGETGEHYLSFSGEDATSTSLWNDLPGDILLPFVCEWEPTNTPSLMPTSDLRVTNPGNGHLYLVVNTRLGWHEAVNDCIARGGYLVTIQSDAENEFVHQLNPQTWLGATDEFQEGIWVWANGEPWSYTNWYPGEPNDGDSDFIHYWGDSTGWDDLPDFEMPFICEWEP